MAWPPRPLRRRQPDRPEATTADNGRVRQARAGICQSCSAIVLGHVRRVERSGRCCHGRCGEPLISPDNLWRGRIRFIVGRRNLHTCIVERVEDIGVHHRQRRPSIRRVLDSLRTADPATVSEQEQRPRQAGRQTTTGRSISTSARQRRRARRRTGSRPFPARAGSSTCGSMVRSNRSGTGPGGWARSCW